MKLRDRALSFMLLGTVVVCGTGSAQDRVEIVDGKPVRVSPGGSGPTRPSSGPTPSGAPTASAKPGSEPGSAKPGGGSDASDAELKVIRRDQLGDQTADPGELGATVGEDGRVAFQFRNQPWVALVQWLSDICDQPLDWQELPGDRVNLASPGRYTVAETRDLFNRHLLARGYAILEVDGGLTIVKTASVNPALVRRVDERELAGLPAYSFVRTLLDVGWLSAEKLSEELKPMISVNGRLTALSTTNRIEAMDAAVNLRQVAELLAQERDSASRDALAPEFRLRYIPAEEAKRLLEQFLGVEKKDAVPLTPQQIQMQQQQQRMQQQAQGQATAAEPKTEIAIVANVRQNSVLVRAPQDRVAIAAEFIKRIDVPGESLTSLADVKSRVQVSRLASVDPEKLIEIISEMNVLEPTTRLRADKENQAIIVSGSAADRFIIDSLIERLDGSGRQFEVLQLRRLDAAEVAESITFLMGQQDKKDDQQSNRRPYYYGFMGGTEETKSNQDEFRVSANSRYNQVLLWANPTEMNEVRSLLVKLGELPPPGGSTRTVRVIDASATPETYEYLQNLRRQWESMAGNPLEIPEADLFRDPIAETKAELEAKSQPANQDKTEPANQGKAESDPARSQPSGSDSKGSDAPASDEEKGTQPAEEDVVISRPNSAEQHLTAQQVDSQQVDSQQNDSQPGDSQISDSQQNDSQPGGFFSGSDGLSSGKDDPSSEPGDAAPSEIRSLEDFERRFGGGAGRVPPSAASATEAPAIRISVDSEGNLVLSSSDTAALDMLENLMLQAKPPRRPYHVFKIRHATASWVTLNLEDYFKDLEDKQSDDGNSFMRWYYGIGDDSKNDGPAGLGREKKLRFVWDNDTNTIVVSGASTDQLRTIAELIELWDVKESVDQRRMRFTKMVPIRFSKASEVAETVKEAFRDLLSSNDKAFGQAQRGSQPGGGSGRSGSSEPRNREGDGSGLTDQESGREGGGSNFSFTGKLSIGIDEVGNTLVVGAEGESLLTLVEGVIKRLDEAARPSGDVEVLTLSGSVGTNSLSRALESLGVGPVNGNGNAGNRDKRNGDNPRGGPVGANAGGGAAAANQSVAGQSSP